MLESHQVNKGKIFNIESNKKYTLFGYSSRLNEKLTKLVPHKLLMVNIHKLSALPLLIYL